MPDLVRYATYILALNLAPLATSPVPKPIATFTELTHQIAAVSKTWQLGDSSNGHWLAILKNLVSIDRIPGFKQKNDATVRKSAAYKSYDSYP
ncbi:hypothetical protein KEM54_001010 [Ascosphaera aggregata]|nr:hypothetical protein KEM54_001010 [Ascosphaera aggregata]